MNGKTMRKKWGMVLAVCLVIWLAGCGPKKTDTPDVNIEDNTTESGQTADAAFSDSPEWVGKLPAAADAKQLFVVAGVGETTAYVSMHEKDENGNWKEIMTTPGYIGKAGLGKTKEGDAKTPVGTFHFTKAFGIADDVGCAMPYQKVTDDDYWSGDQRDGYKYNEMVSIKDYPDLDTDESEHIVDYTYQYQYCLNISYNEEGKAGAGSAIFLHCLGPYKPYTGGCVAIPKEQMIKVMQNVDKDCVVVIDTLSNISPEMYDDWGLAGMSSSSDVSDAEFVYWSEDSEAAASIRDYVAMVTDETNDAYIPVEDRIAVFDMDGTLTCETYYTYYDTMMFINYCLTDHPERVSDELKDAAMEIKPGYTAGEELARNFAKAYAGMTIEELYDYAVEFGQKETDSFENMRYIDGFYLPMVELVKYLYENDFTIYVVSGTERTTTRAIVANSPISEYVSPSHVIGTEFEVKKRGSEDVSSNMDYKYADGDDLVFTGGFIQKNLNANKSIWIEREIGQRPVLAFGNSGSDTSMMNYVLDSRNPYQTRAYMIVADDDIREWGTQNWAEKSAAYSGQGYVPISMKNDFLQIYPETIKKSDTQYTETEEELQNAA